MKAATQSTKTGRKRRDAAPAGPADERRAFAFAAVVRSFARDAAVEPPDEARRAFGSNALKAGGKIFAMFVRGQLVVKLPAARVEELVCAGEGQPFDAGKGKPMKEWLAVTAPEAGWLAFAKEARAFVGPPRK